MPGIEYEDSTAASGCGHPYLLPCVEKFLSGAANGLRVLDLGCGNGSFLASFGGRGWRLHGTDFSPTGVAIAQQNFPDIDFFPADASVSAETILQSAGLVDVVISTEVIEHLYDPRGMLCNAAAVLKPGGILIVSTPYHGYLKNLLLALTDKLDRHFTVLWDHGHIKFWSRATLTQALEEGGYRYPFRGGGTRAMALEEHGASST